MREAGTADDISHIKIRGDGAQFSPRQGISTLTCSVLAMAVGAGAPDLCYQRGCLRGERCRRVKQVLIDPTFSWLAPLTISSK